MGPVRVVCDTNVFISAFGFGGTPLEAVLRACRSDCRIVVSEQTLAELGRVMQYTRLPFTDEERGQYLSVLTREAERVDPDAEPNVIERDPDDNAFLACATAAQADYVVSGDEHLLALGKYRDTEIVTPAGFLERIQ
ncbi:MULTISPECIES: putative toxin-antitoxin system toxin component, PIN family [Salinibaculum]|uniref:putative toxin-antitoxin system toxin component, PIN family n=1 Tax=Salinibaculum TaxID=2732368 RepID=UPI0030D51EBF